VPYMALIPLSEGKLCLEELLLKLGLASFYSSK
jgi:hypothetical protein